MNKYPLFFIILIFSFFANGFSQSDIWKNHTQMTFVNEIAATEKGIWAATKGGAFYYSFIDSTFEKFTSTEGLKSINITAIDIDKYGRVWLGAADGNINIYNPQNKQWQYVVILFNSDKPSKRINHIYATDSIVYISSDIGLSLVKLDNLQFGDTYSNFSGLAADLRINSIFIEDTIWVATESGLAVQKSKKINYLAPENWTSYTTLNGLGSNLIYSVTRFFDTLYVATSQGVYYLRNNSFLSKFSTLQGQEIIKLLPKGDTLLVATKNRIYGYHKGNLNLIYDYQQYSFNDLISSKDRKNIFVATTNGIMTTISNQIKYLFPNGPNANLFPYMIVDNTGALWSSSGDDRVCKGFYRLKNGEWKNYLVDEYPILASNCYFRMFKTSDNTIWALSYGRGLVKLANDTPAIKYDNTNTGILGISINPNFIVCKGAAEDSKGNVWFLIYKAGNQRTIVKLTKDNKWEFFTNEYNPNAINLADIVIDNYDTKFIYSEGEGIYYFNENGVNSKKWGLITTANGLNSPFITSMVIDKQGELWIGNKTGANVIYNTQRPEAQVISVFALRNQTVNCIAVDGLNNKWVGTTNGVWVISSDGSTLLEQFNTKNSPLINNDVKSIAIDNKTGIIYFGTEEGLTVYKSNAIEPKAEFETLNIFPNPFIIGKHKYITIDGLVANSDLKILTSDGKLIRNLATNGGRVGYWDGKDSKNNFVDSGVYFIVAYAQNGNKSIVGKVAIVKQ